MIHLFRGSQTKCFGLLAIILMLMFFNSFLEGQPVPTESSKPLILQVKKRELFVNGKKSTFPIFQIAQLNGIQGLSLKKGDRFYVILENHMDQPTGVHWHGILLPNSQDGVPFVTQPAIPPGGKYTYDFPIIQSGTYWMHAHYGLQEQQLVTAPLILHDPNDVNANQQEIVMFLSDFTFQNPLDIFKELRNQGSKVKAPQDSENHQMMHMSAAQESKKMIEMPQNEMKHMNMMKMDLNDVKYDAFLTNWRTLSDPDIIEVTPEKEVRLRIINGSSSTNFFILLGKLKGEAIAIDGADITPFSGTQFELAVAQRIDIRIKIPQGKSVYPILAQGEGLEMQTGLILATPGAQIPALKEKASQAMGAMSYTQEFLLKAKDPLIKKEINRKLTLNLEGNMAKYVWLLNGKAWPYNEPLMVKEGERVEISFVNRTMMAHPMHLHGHYFQITEINGQPLNGALRDTVLVLPHSTVKVQFDADNPGNWPLHCHNLYHQYAGMMTTLNYEGFKGPDFTIEERMHE